jgi:DNA-binding CsgD family transcriptional regulator
VINMLVGKPPLLTDASSAYAVAREADPIIDAVRALACGLDSVNLSRLPPAARSELQFWLALMPHQTGDPLRQRRLVAEALDALPGRPDLRAWGMIGLGTPCGTPGVPLSQHLRWLHRSLDVLPLVAPAPGMLMLGQVASVLAVVGDPMWRRLTDRILAQAGTAPSGAVALRTYEAVGAAAGYAGHHEMARRLLSGAISGSRAGDQQKGRAHARLALLDYCHGRWDGLRERAEQLVTEVSDQSARTDAEIAVACLSLAHGEFDHARQRLTHIVEMTARTGAIDVMPLAASTLIRQAVTAGDVSGAVTAAQRLLATVPEYGGWAPAVRALPWVARALVDAGRGADAVSALHRVRDQLRGLDVPLGPAATAHAQAILTSGHRHWLPAASHFLAAADRYEQSGCRYEAAQAREQAAECLFESGDPRAGRTLRAAVATYQRLGAGWDATRASGTAIRHGMPLPVYPREERRPGWDLSPRQRQVAELAAAGLTNEEIAHRLSLSHRTVHKHVGAALQRLGVHSRRSLANYL